MNLLIFIPCFNEEKTIANVIKSLPKKIKFIDQIDVLVVDDGSTDNSYKKANAAGAKVVKHYINKGVGKAFQTALKYSIDNKYDLMINIDADGQFDPADIKKLLKVLLINNADFISASRFLSTEKIDNMSFIKLWGNKRMTSLVNKLTKRRFTDVSCGFRGYTREALLRLNLYGDFTYTQESFLNLAFQGINMLETPIKVKYFSNRKSKVAKNLIAYMLQTVKIILRTYLDYQPFKFFSTFSFLFASIGGAIMLFLFYWRLIQGSFTPNIWLGFTGGGLILISILLFMIGLLADMFCRNRRNQEEILYQLRSSYKQGIPLKNNYI